jgi:hypothetical protein
MIDGLVFYDQFGRLAVYQIVLVSLGVLVLLVGVWVVSAVQPTGQGGVDIGTWVEEEEEGDMEFSETSPLFRSNNQEYNFHESPTSSSPPSQYPQPAHSLPPTPTIHAPGVFDDSNPPSPTLSLSNKRRRRTRYGTLVPDLPQGAPTGVSIGLGASSPGFVLRPAGGSFSHPNEAGHGSRRGRSRSEDIRGIQAIMRGDPISPLHQEGVSEEPGQEGVEGVRERRESWFGRLVGARRGRVRLEDEHEGGDGGDGD